MFLRRYRKKWKSRKDLQEIESPIVKKKIDRKKRKLVNDLLNRTYDKYLPNYK